MDFLLIDGINPEITLKLGPYKDSGEAISDINERFKKGRFKFWLKESAILKESDNSNKDGKSFPIIIKGKDKERIAEFGS